MVEGLGRRIVVVEDEPILGSLISDRLRLIGFESWHAIDAFEAKNLVLQHDADAMIVDLDLGSGPTGMELVLSVSALNPNLGFVLFSNFTPTPWELSSATNLTFVRKKDVKQFHELLQALEAVLRYAPTAGTEMGSSPATELSTLTGKQLKTLELMALGFSNPEIAKELGVSKGAVEQTAKRIYTALGLSEKGKNRRVQAVQLFNRNMGPRRGK